MARWGTGAIGNSSRGSKIQGVPQSIYAQSSVQMAPIGVGMELEDGRKFRYGQAAGTITAGKLVAPSVAATSVVEIDAGPTATFAAGVTEVILDDSALASKAADQYAGGTLHITDDAGEGHGYRIKGNTASSTNSITFTLYDGLVVAIGTGTDVAITGSLYKELVEATAATDCLVAGVSMCAVTDNYYAWFQTTGVATVLSDGTPTFGDQLTLSDDGSISGAVQIQDAYTEQTVGFATFSSDDTGYIGVVLNIGGV